MTIVNLITNIETELKNNSTLAAKTDQWVETLLAHIQATQIQAQQLANDLQKIEDEIKRGRGVVAGEFNDRAKALTAIIGEGE